MEEAQTDLGIKQEASYIITIKNLEASSPQGMDLPAEEKVDLPEHLQSRFQERRMCDRTYGSKQLKLDRG